MGAKAQRDTEKEGDGQRTERHTKDTEQRQGKARRGTETEGDVQRTERHREDRSEDMF